MHIFMIVPTFSPNIGGVEAYMDDLCAYLAGQNHEVSVMTYQPLTTKARGPAYEKRGGVEIRRISWFGHNWFHKLEPYPALEFLYLTPGLFLHAFLFMLKYARSIDRIHAQGLNAAFIARFLGRFFGKKTVMSTCAVYGFKRGSLFARIARWTLSGADRVLALAEHSRRELVSIGVPDDRIKTYHLWIDQEVYQPRDKKTVRQELGLNAAFIVLFVGRFIRIKGVEVMLDVARRTDRNIGFYFIGDNGPMLETLERASSGSKNIVLVRNVRGRQLVPYYQAADLLVVPSQYEEAFGKVIIEALSCGTPVIGARKGAIPDILASSVGRVVEPSAMNIKREIEFFYDNPMDLSNLTASCREYAVRNFSRNNAWIIEKSYLTN